MSQTYARVKIEDEDGNFLYVNCGKHDLAELFIEVVNRLTDATATFD